ncbi:MAG: type II toxin-antitoxin system RelE/ParE family toxin [Bacteroidia bacterium]
MTVPKEMLKSFGQLALKINQRLEELKAADSLIVMRTLPAARCHELTGDRKGTLAVNISGNYRMIFEPYHNPIPQTNDGGLDWAAITKIKILEIEDYH